MAYHEWHVGMKVVCISDLSQHPAKMQWDVSVPQQGRVYTLRELFQEPRHHRPNAIFVRLAEVVNRPVNCDFGPYEAGFDARHFRPVQEREADISIFTAMLNPQKQVVDA